MVYTFTAAIPKRDSQTDNWHEWLQQYFEASNLFLSDDENLYYGDNLVGFYRLLELEEAKASFQSTSWFTLTTAEVCLWLGSIVGFFNWTHAPDQSLAEEHLLPKLVSLGCPVIARTDNNHFKQAIRRMEFDLTNLLSKYGFEDGDALLSRDEDYLLYVHQEINQRLEKAGLNGHVTILETAHNPLMLSEDLLQNGKKVSNERGTLSKLLIDIWAYDWSILRDVEFWLD
jgi:hypothetical protein